LATLVYGAIGRKLELRTLLATGLAGVSAGLWAYVFYRSLAAAVVIELLQGFLLTMAGLALMEAAVWATPKVAAAVGFAVLMSALNLGVTTGDVLSTILMERWPIGFYGLMQIYAAAAATMLGALLILPKNLFARREAATPG
jgi:predicted MFS family arabinose efflux permease